MAIQALAVPQAATHQAVAHFLQKCYSKSFRPLFKPYRAAVLVAQVALRVATWAVAECLLQALRLAWVVAECLLQVLAAEPGNALAWHWLAIL